MADGVGAEIGGQIAGKGMGSAVAELDGQSLITDAKPNIQVSPGAALAEDLSHEPVPDALRDLAAEAQNGGGEDSMDVPKPRPEKTPIDIINEKIDEKLNGGEDSGTLSTEMQKSFDDFYDRKKDLELKLADPNTPEDQKVGMQTEYDQTYKGKEWQAPAEKVPQLDAAGGSDAMAPAGSAKAPPADAAAAEKSIDQRPNTPAGRAMARATQGKTPEQIASDQAWLASEDPERVGFRIDGQPIATAQPSDIEGFDQPTSGPDTTTPDTAAAGPEDPAMKSLLDSVRDGSFDNTKFGNLTPEQQKFLKDSLSPEEFSQIRKLPSSEVTAQMIAARPQTDPAGVVGKVGPLDPPDRGASHAEEPPLAGSPDQSAAGQEPEAPAAGPPPEDDGSHEPVDPKAEEPTLAGSPAQPPEGPPNSPPTETAAPPSEDLPEDIRNMSAQEIAEEQERLYNKVNQTAADQLRIQQLESAWDAKHIDIPDPDAEFDTEEKRVQAARSDDPEVRARWQEYKDKKVKEAEAAVLFQGLSDDEKKQKIEDVTARWNTTGATFTEEDRRIAKHLGLEVNPEEQSQIAEAQKALDEDRPLSPYLESLREKHGLEKNTLGEQEDRELEIQRLEILVDNGQATPEDIANLNKYKKEKTEGDEKVNERDILRDKLKKIGLSEDEEARLVALEAETKGREKPLTQEQIDEIGIKFIEDFMNGKAFDKKGRLTPAAENSLNKMNAYQIEQALTSTGGLSATEARNAARDILERKSQGENKKLAIENRVRAKLQQLMAVEIQAMGIPQQLEDWRKTREELKTNIKKKEAEVNQIKIEDPAHTQKSAELNGMMLSLARTKSQIARVKNMGRILSVQYKQTMASVKRDLGLTGRFGGLIAWGEARLMNGLLDAKMNFDSVYGSD